MNRRIITILVFLLMGFGFSSRAQCPPNIDFELGNTSIWNYFIGSCCPISTPTSTSAISDRHTLTSGTAVDPFGFFPIVPPGGGSYAMRLGNSLVGAEAEKARYYINVPAGSTNFSLVYRYAVVLQDVGHPAAAQPRFQVSAYDSATGNAIPCAQYNYVASATLPGFYQSIITTSGTVYFKNWTTASIDLSGLGGTTVAVDFASGDCDYSGHFGYGYFDMSCGIFAISTVGCDSTSATINAPAGFQSYRWYDSSTFSTLIDTLQTVTIAMPSVPTTYAVIMTPFSGFGCPDTLYSHIIPARLVLNKMNDTSICFGASGPVMLNTGATDIALPLTYTWSPASTLSCTTCATPYASPSSATTYVFTVTDAVGCSATDSIRVSGSLIAATVSTTSAGCYGDSLGTASATITAGTAPFTYTWSTTPPQFGSVATNLSVGIYTVNIVDSTGCNGLATGVVTGLPLNILTLTGSSSPSICGGSDGTITLGGLVPGSVDTIAFLFNGAPQTLILTASSSGSVTLNSLVQGVYSSLSIVTSGCPYNVVGPVTLTDPPIPGPPPGTSPVYCQYDLPSVLSATGSSLLWYSPGSSSGTTTAPTPSTSVPGVDSYYVTQTVAGCVSPRFAISVTVIAKPNPPLVMDTSYCQYYTATALVATGLNLQWYNTASGGTALTAVPVPNTTTPGTSTWYVSQRVNGCESDRAAISVTTLVKPVFTIAQSRPFTCQFDTLTLNYVGPAYVDPAYMWTTAIGSTIITGAVVTPSIVAQFDSLYFQIMTLTVSNYNGRCFTTDTIKINVVPQPAAVASVKENICEGDTVTVALLKRDAGSHHFEWGFNGATLITQNSNSGGPYSVKWTTPGIKVIKLTAYTIEGCRGVDVFDTVRVMPLPDARIFTRTATGTLCMEDSVYLSALDSGDYQHTYQWKPAHFFNNTNKPGIWGRIERAGYVTLTVTDAFGCYNADSVLITPDACCTISFPSAFTPNGDGRNDNFRPLFDGFHRFHNFRIVNRWGQTVFESTNNRMEWDGTFGGVPQDMGVYYYFIKYDCNDDVNGMTSKKEHISKGEVTLIR